jgi:hypothetical protein
MNSKVTVHDVTTALENTQILGDSDMTIRIPYKYNSIIPKGMDVSISNLDNDTDSSEHCDERSHQVEQIVDENEFWGIEFEDLVLLEESQ